MILTVLHSNLELWTNFTLLYQEEHPLAIQDQQHRDPWLSFQENPAIFSDNKTTQFTHVQDKN